MALITCPECKKRISEEAATCPNCGYQLSPERIAEIKAAEQRLGRVTGVGCLVVIAFFVVLYILGSGDKDTPVIPHETSQATEKQPVVLWDKSAFPAHAQAMIRVVRQAEKELQLALETNDPQGLQKYVIDPVNKEFAVWDGQCDGHYPDLSVERSNCVFCNSAASAFRSFAFTYKRADDMENRKSREIYRQQYTDFLKSCANIK